MSHRGPWGHNLELTLELTGVVDKEQKKELSVFNGSFETYTRYFGVVDEEQIKRS